MLLGALVFLSAHFGQEGDIQTGCGAQCPKPAGLSFDVTDFGATPDDATDEDLAAFQAAIDRASAVSLGNNSCAVVSIPPGTYHFQKPAKRNHQGLVLKSNVCLIGEDRDRTTVISMTSMHTIGMHQIDNASVENLIIDNVSSNSIGTHAIRLSDASNILLQDLSIRNANYYGIGFQGSGGFRNITVNDVEISNTGADAIDFKNKGDLNSDILLSNIEIADFGMAVNGQAGIDVRGKVTMKNIDISGVKAGQSGIRFRFDGDGVNGSGGINSSLVDSNISGVAAGGVGIDVTNLGNTIQSTVVSGTGRQGTGIRVSAVDKPEADSNTLLSFVAMLNLDTGIEANAYGITVDAPVFLANNVPLNDRLGAAIVTNSAFGETDSSDQNASSPETKVRAPDEEQDNWF